MQTDDRVEHDDALLWLSKQRSDSAKVVVFDPPYAAKTPQFREAKAGKEHYSAVYGPSAFAWKCLFEVKRVLMVGGIVVLFTDQDRQPDLLYAASSVGLRQSTTVAWIRDRVGTGGIFRSAWDPIPILAKGTPDVVDRSAIRNWVHAEVPSKRRHPHEKPAEVFRHIFRRVCRPGDLVVDPFAGSAVSREVARELECVWRGCDIDPEFAEAG